MGDKAMMIMIRSMTLMHIFPDSVPVSIILLISLTPTNDTIPFISSRREGAFSITHTPYSSVLSLNNT